MVPGLGHHLVLNQEGATGFDDEHANVLGLRRRVEPVSEPKIDIASRSALHRHANLVTSPATTRPTTNPHRTRPQSPQRPAWCHCPIPTRARLAATPRAPLPRPTTGVARDSDADAVLDFTVTLESLLLPMDADARRTELSHRFRLHGAHYLANDPSERADLFKSLRDLYAMRSQLAHGSKYPQPAATHAMRDTAHELARRGLLQAVHNGFPTADLFNRMTLGLTSS